eukprot:5884300-Prymnesium_polylepis.1
MPKKRTRHRPSSRMPAPTKISTRNSSPSSRSKSSCAPTIVRTSRTAARTTRSASTASSGFRLFAKFAEMSNRPRPSESKSDTSAGASTSVSITTSKLLVLTSVWPTRSSTSPGATSPLSAAAPPACRAATRTPASSSRSSSTRPSGFARLTARSLMQTRGARRAAGCRSTADVTARAESACSIVKDATRLASTKTDSSRKARVLCSHRAAIKNKKNTVIALTPENFGGVTQTVTALLR